MTDYPLVTETITPPHRRRGDSIELSLLCRLAADLISDDNENPDYKRAILELTGDALGLTDGEEDTRSLVLDYLRWLKGRT